MPDVPTRRTFLGATASLIPLAALAKGQPAFAADLPADNHLIAEDKHLSRAWLDGLRAKGQPMWYRGDDLARIGMPCGGIGCGQLYLTGDGTLGAWRIFNRPTGQQGPVEQGFALRLGRGPSATWRALSRRGIGGVSFRGEHPIGRVRYFDWDLPVQVELEAWSPFIPLDAQASNLPATVFEFTVRNTSDQPVDVAIGGWLENAVGVNTGDSHNGRAGRVTNLGAARGRGLVQHSGELLAAEAQEVRPGRTLADFEGETYGDWTTEGTAFGTGPARGALEGQNPVAGFEGQGLVNSYLGGDDPQGRLTSPQFTIDRRFLNFLIGGGSQAGKTCLNLLVDGQVVRTATGRDNERLEWRTWSVEEFEGRVAQLEAVDQASGPWGHINVDSIELADEARSGYPPFDECEDFGTLSLVCVGESRPLRDAEAPGLALPLATDATTRWVAPERRAAGLLADGVELAPGAARTFVWVLAWHFPNTPDSMGGRGHWYAARFADATAVAHHVLDNHERFARDTRLWRDTYYDSSLPWWLLDRLHSTLSYLATGTCRWFHNGRFWAWEGVNCCDGTCTHVWNYAHGQARLFPEIERNIRERQDLGEAFDPNTGLVNFRGSHAGYAADGQCGTVLKAYRDHLMSPDSEYLRTNWPKIRRVLEFSMGHDADDNGLIEDSQHNTYDINFEGPNTFVGSLYLAALRAAEKMAREVGDTAFAERCARLFASGAKLSMERLYNGEYFIQEVDLKRHPRFQYAEGCLADQVFGQGWAHHVGLGYIYPPEAVRSALNAVWRYNYATDIGPQNRAHPPQRWFISPGEPGLFICTWPKSKHLGNDGVLYRDEVWTGIEYQVAGHMVWEGMLDEALAICRAVHDRYDPAKRNPYNEIECGDHYSRALASWGVYTALCGYDYHGPAGRLAFAPAYDADHFRAAFTSAEGWGTFDQVRTAAEPQTNRLSLAWGKLVLGELELAVPDSVKQASVSVDGQPVVAQLQSRDGKLTLSFDQPLVLNAGQTLEVRAT